MARYTLFKCWFSPFFKNAIFFLYFTEVDFLLGEVISNRYTIFYSELSNTDTESVRKRSWSMLALRGEICGIESEMFTSNRSTICSTGQVLVKCTSLFKNWIIGRSEIGDKFHIFSLLDMEWKSINKICNFRKTYTWNCLRIIFIGFTLT